MDDIVYSNNPNEDSVQVQIEGKYRKVSLMRSIGDAEVIYQDNPNVGKVLFTGEDGKKHTATLVMDINGGGSGVTSVNGKTGDVVLDASDVGAVTQTVDTISLASTDWSSHTQTVTVTGVTADNTVIVAPAPASAADYAAAEILCTAQAANSLTFTCTTDPTNNISVNVVILN